MSISIQAETKDKHVYLTCKGLYNLNEMLRVYEAALTLTQCEHRKSVLIDVTDLGGEPATVLERFDQVCYIAALQIPRPIKLFLLGREPMIDPLKFGEVVLLNRGGQGWTFTCLESAVNWIQKMSV